MSGFLDDLPEEDIESIPVDYYGALEASKRGRLYARTGDCDIFEWQGKCYILPPSPGRLSNRECPRCGPRVFARPHGLRGWLRGWRCRGCE